MNILYEGKPHRVVLIDDGTLDTVIEVDGIQHRYDSAYVQRYRNENGMLTELGIKELGIQCIEHQEKD